MSVEFFKEKLLFWERDLKVSKGSAFETNREDWFQKVVQSLKPHHRDEVLALIDDIMLYMYHLLEGISADKGIRNPIIQAGLVFRDGIEHIEHMQKLTLAQLTSIAEQQYKKRKLYSFLQGGVLGAVPSLFVPASFPLSIATNLRTIQVTGLSFGYEMNKPNEMILAINLFYGATLPKRYQYPVWIKLKECIQSNDSITFEKKENVLDESWFTFPLDQLIKFLFIKLYRKKYIKGMPLMSMGIGSLTNYQLSKKVCDFSLHFFQYRYLYEKGFL